MIKERTPKYIGRQGGGIALKDNKMLASFSVQKMGVKIDKDNVKYCEICAEADEYLKGNKLNSICSESILHKKFAESARTEKNKCVEKDFDVKYIIETKKHGMILWKKVDLVVAIDLDEALSKMRSLKKVTLQQHFRIKMTTTQYMYD